MNLRLNKVIFSMFFLVLSCSKQGPVYIDGNDLVPPEPPFWDYFTVRGSDADLDGVRDDVELWINEEFTDPNIRRAMKWKTSAIYRLMFAESTSAALKLIKEREKAGDCLMGVSQYLEKDESLASVFRTLEIQKRVTNNFWRTNQENKAYRYVPNGSYSVGTMNVRKAIEACPFKVLNLKKLFQHYYDHGLYKNNSSDEERKDYKKYLESLNDTL